MLFGRNYKIGKAHLTHDGKTTLCRVPLTNTDYPSFPAEIINKTTTCALCLKLYDEQNKGKQKEIKEKQNANV